MSWFTFNSQDFSISFLSILFEGVPFMFIGTLLSGIIDAFVPSETIEKVDYGDYPEPVIVADSIKKTKPPREKYLY